MEINKYKTNNNSLDIFEFRLFHAGLDRTRKIIWKKSVGAAQLISGKRFYTLNLWTLLSEEYFLVPKDDAQTKYLIYSKVRVRINEKTITLKWNVVGSGTLDSAIGAIILKFDLFEKPIYLNIYSCKAVKAGFAKNKVA